MAGGYERRELLRESLKGYKGGVIPEGRFFVYVTSKPGTSSDENPVIQSYLDIVLTGCLKQFDEDFAREMIETTTGWGGPYFNDRERPRYPRALTSVECASQIDELLISVLS